MNTDIKTLNFLENMEERKLDSITVKAFPANSGCRNSSQQENLSESGLRVDYVPLAHRRAQRNISRKSYVEDAELEIEVSIKTTKPQKRQNGRKKSEWITSCGKTSNSASDIEICTTTDEDYTKDRHLQTETNSLTNLPTPCGYDKVQGRAKNWRHPMCHQCQRSDKLVGAITCERGKGCHGCSFSLGEKRTGGQKKFLCVPKTYCRHCIKTWYGGFNEEDVKVSCFSCRGICNCKDCLSKPMKSPYKGDNSTTDEANHLRLTLSYLLPFLEALDLEQKLEVLEESSQYKKLQKGERLNCERCQTSIPDVYRECSACEAEICIKCCKELRNDQGEEKNVLKCPKGCDGGELKPFSLLPKNYVQNLLSEIRDLGIVSRKSQPTNLACEKCPLKKFLEEEEYFCKGKGESVGSIPKRDNLSLEENHRLRLGVNRDPKYEMPIWCPTFQDVNSMDESEGHFQHHWEHSEPVVVRNVLKEESIKFLWQPEVMHRAVRQMGQKGQEIAESKEVEAIDCYNWNYVPVNIHKFFATYKKLKIHMEVEKEGMPEILKLKDWPAESDFGERLPRHGDDFISSLPFHQYTHPSHGILNLATKFPEGSLTPDLGPKSYIGYGVKQELLKGDSVTKLHLDMADAVNILTHAHENNLAEEEKKLIQLRRLRMKHELNLLENDKAGNFFSEQSGEESTVDEPLGGLKRRTRGHNERPGKRFKAVFEEDVVIAEEEKMRQEDLLPGSAIWDIFRKEDSGKLKDFLEKHRHEFFNGDGTVEHVQDAIHDQTFFLTAEHKALLKKEHGVIPWTFHQDVGDAVFIPAGCAHQVRNIQSCIKVAVDFISPQSVEQCVKLVDEYRALPVSHPCKEDKLQIWASVIHGAIVAVKRLKKLSLSQ